ncbi:hypothetical protein MAPG_03095 [Magnaporthiopsis poae ATCC 64411]|uniref:Uncharacterized protein n=1 Tax=Magnaporthiopsis poae (strain ATCC 64411 / 73-15) TaxID=644358 RepID=A0A0C4DT40_MAGP6|nr:hypothetical protein MAPG_03095 [Magnaporthiopsis poae ATCC 64411]
MLAALMDVAHDIEDVILTGKSDMIWSSASAAAGGTLAMPDLPSQQAAVAQHHHHQQHGGVAVEPFDNMMGVDFLGSFP